MSIAAQAKEDGFEAAAEVAQFEADHVAAIKELVEKEKIDCDFVITRAMDVPLQADIRDELEAGRQMLAKAGVKTAKDTFSSSQEAAEGVQNSLFSIENSNHELTRADIRCQRRQRVFLIHSRSYIPLQTRSSSSQAGRLPRSKPSNPHASHINLRFL